MFNEEQFFGNNEGQAEIQQFGSNEYIVYHPHQLKQMELIKTISLHPSVIASINKDVLPGDLDISRTFFEEFEFTFFGESMKIEFERRELGFFDKISGLLFTNSIALDTWFGVDQNILQRMDEDMPVALNKGLDFATVYNGNTLAIVGITERGNRVLKQYGDPKQLPCMKSFQTMGGTSALIMPFAKEVSRTSYNPIEGMPSAS